MARTPPTGDPLSARLLAILAAWKTDSRGAFPRLDIVRLIDGERPVSAHVQRPHPIDPAEMNRGAVRMRGLIYPAATRFGARSGCRRLGGNASVLGWSAP